MATASILQILAIPQIPLYPPNPRLSNYVKTVGRNLDLPSRITTSFPGPKKLENCCIGLIMGAIQPKIGEPVSDEMALVLAAKGGDISAFEQLVKRYDRNV